MKQIIKKVIAAVICGSLLLSLAACGGNDKEIPIREHNNIPRDVENEEGVIKPYTKVDGEVLELDEISFQIIGYEIYHNDKNQDILFINCKVTNNSLEEFDSNNDLLITSFQNGVSLPNRLFGYIPTELTIQSTEKIILKSGGTTDRFNYAVGDLDNLQDDVEIEFVKYDKNRVVKDKKTTKISIK